MQFLLLNVNRSRSGIEGRRQIVDLLPGEFNSVNFKRNVEMKKAILLSACVALVFVLTNTQAEEKAKKVTTVNCVVAGKEIKIADAKVAKYRDASVYVCCGKCKAALEKDSTKFATKANHQLFLTSQAKQTKCPISGRDLDATKTVKISGVSVAFCCGNCQGKADKAKGDDQLAIAFADKAFDKGFKVNKKSKK